MKRSLLALITVLVLSLPLVAQTVLGIEAAGPDSATQKAWTWRSTHVYDTIYKNFNVVPVTQSDKTKVLNALQNNNITHITGCGHGLYDRYTGYSGTIFRTSDPGTLDKLAGMHIHLLSCQTAQQLGPAMIQHGAASYCGYYPNFSFTWKSADDFFDADAELDRQFAAGNDAVAAKQATIAKFNAVIDKVQSTDPSAVSLLEKDRDGLRCFSQAVPNDQPVRSTNVYDLSYATYVLYAQDPATRGYISFADYQKARVRGASFRQMAAADFKALVLATYQRCKADFAIGIISYGKFTRDQLLAEISQESPVGRYMITVTREHLQNVAQARWSKSIEVQTDAEGAISFDDTFDVPMGITVTGVKADAAFDNVFASLDGTTLYNGAVEANHTYDVSPNVPVSSGEHAAVVKASGGPANTTVKVTLYFRLGS